jgi:hypothetical protein
MPEAVRSYKSAGQGNQKSYDIPILEPGLVTGAPKGRRETYCLLVKAISKQIIAVCY